MPNPVTFTNFATRTDETDDWILANKPKPSGKPGLNVVTITAPRNIDIRVGKLKFAMTQGQKLELYYPNILPVRRGKTTRLSTLIAAILDAADNQPELFPHLHPIWDKDHT